MQISRIIVSLHYSTLCGLPRKASVRGTRDSICSPSSPPSSARRSCVLFLCRATKIYTENVQHTGEGGDEGLQADRDPSSEHRNAVGNAVNSTIMYANYYTRVIHIDL